ncbi:MAG: hypothetical protein IMY71_03220, partial [Bacteroidetes bacterium]|nr:hypothetical protein [Bacteroidota bacterium]
PHMTDEQIAVTADIFFEMQDFPRADDIAARLKKLIPPELLEGDEQGDTAEQGEGGIPGAEGMPPEGMEEPPPDPVMIMEMQKAESESQIQQIKIQEEEAKLEITQIKLQQEKVKLEGMRLENDLKVKVGKEDVRALVDEMLQEDAAPMGEA